MQATDNVSNGIDVTFSERISVRLSTASGNGLSGIVDRFTQDSRYARNTVTDNSSPGLVLNGSDGVVAVRNHAVANAGDGIFADQPGKTVARNQAVTNQGIGIAFPDGTIDGGRNRASGNLGGDCTGVACG